jgi:hypothetical protein
MNRRAGWRIARIVSLPAVLAGCAAGAQPLRLPPGHPADPATPGLAGGDRKPDTPSPEPAKAALYACPMHPEVTSTDPGRCPKCGMVLQPVRDR